MQQKIHKSSLNSSQIYAEGIVVTNVNITFKSEAIYAMFKTFYSADLTVSTTAGRGVMKYVGDQNAKGSIFLGSSNTLDSNVLKISGPNTSQILSDLNQKVLKSPEFKDKLLELKLSSIQSIYTLPSMPTIFALSDFLSHIDVTVKNQKRRTPKFFADKGYLQVGSSTGNNAFSISAAVTSTQVVSNLVISYKCKDTTASKIFLNFIQNSGVSLETCVANQMLQLINSLTLCTMLDHVRVDLLRKYAIGSITVQVTPNKVTTTAAGSYVARSLSGVYNKLVNESTSIEAQTLLQGFLSQVIRTQDRLKNGKAFVDNLAPLFKGSEKTTSNKK